MKKKNKTRPLIRCFKYYVGNHAFYDTRSLEVSIELVSAIFQAAAEERTWFVIHAESPIAPSPSVGWRSRPFDCMEVGHLTRNADMDRESSREIRIYLSNALMRVRHFTANLIRERFGKEAV